MAKNQPVALFDMDGTICDYVGAMKRELEKLVAPNEKYVDPFIFNDDPGLQYLWNRMDMIKADENWWAELPRLQLGFDVLDMTTELGYFNEILTQAPKMSPEALTGKRKWILNNFLDDIPYTMTTNKSRHYGRVLVDDFLGFVVPWLEYRPRGLVIMPANEYNEGFEHPRVIMYDGQNKDEVRSALEEAMFGGDQNGL